MIQLSFTVVDVGTDGLILQAFLSERDAAQRPIPPDARRVVLNEPLPALEMGQYVVCGTTLVPRQRAAPAMAEHTAAHQYLNATDWYVTRRAETGAPIPDDILRAREVARQTISATRKDRPT